MLVKCLYSTGMESLFVEQLLDGQDAEWIQWQGQRMSGDVDRSNIGVTHPHAGRYIKNIWHQGQGWLHVFWQEASKLLPVGLVMTTIVVM